MKKVKIIVDAMGGDNAPVSVVTGAVEGAAEYGTDLILVGDKPQLELILSGMNTADVRIETVHSETTVLMTDDPMCVTKEKRNSSMAAACELLRDGKGDIMISSGNTGALFTAGTLIVRRHHGIRRAALATVINLGRPFVLLDSGANLDVTPEVLVQFGIMGSLYCREMLGMENPRVGLLNNGTEECKGPQIYREAFALLKESGLNFVGNCEARDIAGDICDVVLCDGFTGNIALKTLEGMGQFMLTNLKDIFKSNLLASLMLLPKIKQFKKSVDHKSYGGAPFLGISKPIIKSHGSAEAKSIKATIKQARDYCLSGLNEKIAEGLADFEKK